MATLRAIYEKIERAAGLSVTACRCYYSGVNFDIELVPDPTYPDAYAVYGIGLKKLLADA